MNKDTLLPHWGTATILDEPAMPLPKESQGHLFRNGELIHSLTSHWGDVALTSFTEAQAGDLVLLVPLEKPLRLYRAKQRRNKPVAWRRVQDPELIKTLQLLLLLQKR